MNGVQSIRKLRRQKNHLSWWYANLRMTTALVAVTFLIVLNTVSPVQSSDQESDYSQELAEVRSQIKKLKNEATKYQAQRDSFQKDITKLEKRLASIDSKRFETRQKIAQQNQEQERLQDKKKKQIVELENHSADLKNLIRASFAISRLDYVKILLSEDNPSRLSRTVAYYRYLTHARARRVAQLQAIGRELEETEDSLRLNRQALEALSADLSSQLDELRNLKLDMNTSVAMFNERLQSSQEDIRRMKAEEERLLELIERLKERKVVPSYSGKSFLSMKGNLSLPLNTKIQARFGQQKSIRGAYWQGLLLSANSGQDVRSIFTGQVVYSSYFEGFGILVIVDHGGNFLSLYAHNKESKVQVGDWVDTQQVISVADGNISTPTPGLYFELRHNGLPIDPLLWCRF